MHLYKIKDFGNLRAQLLALWLNYATGWTSGYVFTGMTAYGINNPKQSVSSNNNLFYYNNFINNTISAWGEYSNNWDNGTHGNYWDTYDELGEGAIDSDTDGIADSPYAIPGDSNQDNYPSMNPYN